MENINDRIAALAPEQREALLAKLAASRQKTGTVSAIPRRAGTGPARLSFAQQRLWLLYQFSATSAYHIPMPVRLQGPLDVDALRRALEQLGSRHEGLRTRFLAIDGQPRQVVDEHATLTLRVVDIEARADADVESELQRLAAQELAEPFDLTSAPLVRATLMRTSAERAVLMVVIHHLVCDGLSVDILIRELLTLYTATREQRPSPLEPLAIQYADFAEWQRDQMQGEPLRELLEYWQTRLEAAPTLALPYDRPRPAVFTFAGASVRRTLPATLAASLKQLARDEKATLSMVFLAAFQALLSRYSGQDDVVVGSAVANRTRPDVESLVGCFVNTLVMRTDLSGDPSFRELLGRAREVSVGAFDRQDLPFEMVVEQLQPDRQLGQNPLFQAVLSFNSGRVADSSVVGDLTVAGFEMPITTNRFDLELHVFDRLNKLNIELCFSRDLFESSTIQRMLGHLERLLSEAASAPERRLSQLSLLGEEERQRLIVEYNDTTREYPRESSIAKLVERHAVERPGAMAVSWGTTSLTYDALDRRANKVANHLRRHGVGRGSHVALAVERGPNLIVGLLAILKAGGAYVPLDPQYPSERLAFMLQDTAPPVLLTEARLAAAMPAHNSRVISFDTDAAAIEAESDDALACETSGSDVACVLYTSGSTGRPKGVCIPHRGITRLVWQASYASLSADDVVGQASSPSFDATTFEVWGALLNGARLVGIPKEIALSPGLLADHIRDQGITALLLTTALFNQVARERPDAFAGVRHMTFGGEVVDPRAVASVLRTAPPGHLVNLYGPTENSTVSSSYEIRSLADDATTVPIGRAISNSTVYVLDPSLRPVPMGVAGELFVGGDGLASGYLHQPALTAERFVPSPFGDGQRLYRTGDLVRWRSDGQIEFLGRSDEQVKIRGFRIEPGEIEAVLASHPSVHAAVVLVRETAPRVKQLVAYVVFAAGAEVDTASLRAYLKTKLPDYMVPAALVELEALPLNANGKLDRDALPLPSADRQDEATFEAPKSDLERRIAGIWQAALGLTSVGVRDNFFDLGGHSLLLINVHAQLVESLGVNVRIVELFQYPTIESLAEHLSGTVESPETTSAPAIAPVPASRAVVVVGMAGRFPGAPDLTAFWNNLRDGVESIRFFTEAELADAGVSEASLRDPKYVRARGKLDDVDRFDAAFFGFSAREAELLDPQHRLFLECAWHALEDASCDPSRFAGRIGVYAGARANTYVLNLLTNPERIASAGALQTLMATAADFLPTRVSYKLNLRGPSVNIQTACSTSLVAVHHACQSLLNRECDVALAGGVSVSVPGTAGYLYQEEGIASPDGHCRAFDAKARGTVGGDGVGIVVLKRLDEALADGDAIRAVILGTAINNDGAMKVGYTAPSVEGQAEVIRLAHAAAQVSPASISYVEAHGTATSLGDPIEIAGLTKAFGADAGAGECAIGSVKTNVGHLDAAAGVAGLIKTILALEHQEIPPSLHYESPNPRIDFESGRFTVNARLRPWSANGTGPLRAGVSSFGIGGTNAHAVVEQAPPQAPTDRSRATQMLMLSARTSEDLDRTTRRLAAHLAQSPSLPLADVAYTLKVGRKPFQHRRVVRCQTIQQAIESLEGRSHNSSIAGAVLAGKPVVAFLFPGQGSQYLGMGRELYHAEPTFQREVDECSHLFLAATGSDIRDVILAQPGEQSGSSLDSTLLTQAALFTIELALARLWMDAGVQPSACLGHSIGEYVAACVAGVLSREDAVSLIAVRGRLMDQAPPGAMLAVMASDSSVRQFLPDDVWIAASNAPTQCVLSGSVPAIAAMESALNARQIECRRLQTSGAFHSGLMNAVLAPLSEAARHVKVGAPQVPFVSNLTGTWLTAADLVEGSYWSRHLRESVRFSEGVERLLEFGANVFVEVGPGRTLTTLVRQHVNAASQAVATIATMASVDQALPEPDRFLDALGRAWIAGVEPDWRRFHAFEKRQRVPLPGYPFASDRYWIERRSLAAEVLPKSMPVKTANPAEWLYQPIWNEVVLDERASDPRVRWTFIGDDDELAGAAALDLERRGADVQKVAVGQSLASALSSKGPSLRIVHAWSPGQAAVSSLMHLVRMLAERRVTDPIDLRVITRRAWAVTGAETVAPEQAMLLGLARVIPQEQPNVRCSIIDVDETSVRSDDLVAALSAEAPAPILALRGARVWTQAFNRRRPSTRTPGSSRIHKGGVYLVTGGLGRIGLVLAEHLVRASGANVVLVGRSNPSDRDRARIEQMERAGSRVLVARADVADIIQMREVLANVDRTFGRLDGVFHLAGATGSDSFRPIAELDGEMCAAQFRPKVEGAKVLATLLAGRQPDFVLLASSISTVLGGLGFGAYASANAFLESFADEQSRSGSTPWVSVAWDGWSFRGAERDSQSSTTMFGASTDRFALTPDEGVVVFDRVFALGRATQIVVSTCDLRERIDHLNAPVDRAPDEVVTATHARPALSTEYAPPGSDDERAIAAIWEDLLGVRPIGIHDNFFELGGHSLLAVQLVFRMTRALDVGASAHHLFEAPTVAGLSEVVAGIRREQAAEADRIAEVLREVGEMSDEEVERLLAQEGAS